MDKSKEITVSKVSLLFSTFLTAENVPPDIGRSALLQCLAMLDAGQDCEKCWCDSCKSVDSCEISNVENAEPDGIRPLPCVGCKEGMRTMPKESQPTCGEYASCNT